MTTCNWLDIGNTGISTDYAQHSFADPDQKKCGIFSDNLPFTIST